MNMLIIKAAKCLASALAAAFIVGPVYAACFTVYDTQNKILYQGQNSPVDLSVPLHRTVPIAFSGGSMVFSLDGTSCPEIDTRIDSKSVLLSAKVSNSQSELNGLFNHHAGITNESQSDHNTASSYGSSSYSRSTAGTDVQVSGYTKANGTHVQPYTRAAAGRGRK